MFLLFDSLYRATPNNEFDLARKYYIFVIAFGIECDLVYSNTENE